MIEVLAVHLVVALVCALLARLGRWVLLVGALAPLATLGWALAHRTQILDGDPVESSFVWVRQLGLTISFRTDAFSFLFLLLVGGIGVLVFAYASQYFGDRPDLGRFTATLVAFAGAMAGLVTADNLLALAVFWELTSVTSYLLIGFEDRTGSVRASALQAMLTTGLGGLAMLGGFVVIGEAAGTFTMSEILLDPADRDRRVGRGGARAARRVHQVGPGARSTSGCPGPWPPRHRSAPTCTRPPW